MCLAQTRKKMHDIGYKIIRCLMKALGKLPLGFHYMWADFFAWLSGSVLHYRKDVVMTNLARCFPEMKYGDLKLVCKDFYRHFGELIAEAVWFAGSTPERLRRSGIVEMDNPELLNCLYDNTPSVFILSSHAGNWELFGGIPSYSGDVKLHSPERDMCVVYKKLSSRVWDEVMKANRVSPVVDKKHYDGALESMEVMRYMVRNRLSRKVYLFVTDQHPYRGSVGIDVGEFMHQPTTSMDGAAKLACKFGMSIAYMHMARESRGHYKMKFATICEDASVMSPTEIMKRYYELLQKDLEAQPSNYLWTHKRWK